MKSTDSSMEESLENSLGNIGKKINDSHLKSVKILLTFFNSKWGLKEEFEKWMHAVKKRSHQLVHGESAGFIIFVRKSWQVM